MELYFLDWVREYSGLSQVRYINKIGAEIFRVDDNGIKRNLSDLSQDKSINKALELKHGEIHITEERVNGEIQNMIWWVPVYVSTANHDGVIGFSISYQYLLDNISQLINSDAETVCLKDKQNLLFFSKKTACNESEGDSWRMSEKIDLPSLNWKLTLTVNPEVFLVEVKEIRFLVFSVIFPFIAVLSFIFTLLFSNQLIHAIRQLVEAAHTMGRGEPLDPINLNRNDELNELAVEINRSATIIESNRNELQKKNHELNSYSNALAHDLRTPLRSICSFSQILEMEAHKKLDKDELDALTRITKASEHMSELIDDILEFSHISSCNINIRDLSLSHIAETITDKWKKEDSDHLINLEIDKNMITMGDSHFLRLALENLLDNARKYSQKNTHVKIKFGSLSQGNGDKAMTVYFIRDNGIGFDMQYADKLFQPFQRLHKNSDYEGTGIGLALVRRIIDRHKQSLAD